MTTRYSVQHESLCDSEPPSSYSVVEDPPAIARPHHAPSPSFFLRMAMRTSRARWFVFLRRVLHYQNGSTTSVGTNPFHSTTWITLEFFALVVQIGVITLTLDMSKKERPVWPIRLWTVGYDIGCLLRLMLFYGRYRQVQRDSLSFGDVEQERLSAESRYYTHSTSLSGGSCFPISIKDPELWCSCLMNRCQNSLDLFFAIWFVLGNVWMFDTRFGSFDQAPNFHLLCVSLLAWNALCYSFPFLLLLLLCCFVPLVSSVVGYNMNMALSDKGASDNEISMLKSWKFGRADASSTPASVDLECCICLTKYKDKDEVRQLPCCHAFHLKCVDQWLRINSSCPLCKQNLVRRA